MPAAPPHEGADPGHDPPIRFVRGAPTAIELAALVGVLMRRPRAAAAGALDGPSAWVGSSRAGTVTPGGLPARPGADAWRRSALPR